MAKYDAILFDFDGVLADTEPIHFGCWAEILAPLGIDLAWEVYCTNCVGVADRDMVRFLATLADPPLKVDTLWPKYDLKKQLFRNKIAEFSPCSDATINILKSLHDYGLAVVSSSEKSEVEPALKKAGIHALFSAIISGEDVKEFKPSPEPYLLAARRLQAKSPLVVEDSAAGVASAKAANFEVIQLASPHDLASQLRAKLEF
jgi:beta-phosphoglucomutase